MNKILLTLTGIILSTVLYAQANDEINEQLLKQQIATGKEDTNKVENLRELAEYYLGIKTDTSLLLAREALSLSIKLEYESGQAIALFTMGKIFVQMGNYPRGLELYLQSLEINERLNDAEWIALDLAYIGEVYTLQGDYRQSMQYLFKSNAIAEKKKLYTTLAKNLMNIGKAYENIGLLDSARFFIEKSYDLVQLHKEDAYLPAKVLFSLGGIYSKTGSVSKAMEFYRLSLAESDKMKDLLVFCNTNLGVAQLFRLSGKSDSAIYYARQALAIALQADFLLQELNAYNFLVQYYQEKSIYDSAFIYLQKSVVVKDSLENKEKIKDFQRISFSEQFRQQEMRQANEQYRNKVRMYILLLGLAAILVVAIVFWRNIRLKKRANALLTLQKAEIDKQKNEIETSYKDLKLTQKQLIQSEKMASLGELTAGIAHEIQNPLNFVNNFSEVNTELIEEAGQEIDKGNISEAKIILNDIKENEEKINHHGKRAGDIVKGMLQHSRASSGVKELTDINKLADEYLRLAYHGLRAKDKTLSAGQAGFNAEMKTDYDETISKITIVPQDIGRVILNLITNAFYAVTEKKKQQPGNYEPTVMVSTKKTGDKVSISVKDNGNGIPQKVLDKIFQPFFTTKPTGQGTGLGLSLSYDIIKAHGGEIKVETEEGSGTTFIIRLPG
jgi:signal transduction histidine kinase